MPEGVRMLRPTRAAAVALPLVLAACGGSSSGGSSVTAQPATTTAPAAPSTSTGGGGAYGYGYGAPAASPSAAALPSFNKHGSATVTGSTLKLEADNFYFEPSVIRGTPGQKVTLTLENSSATAHNFTVKSQHVDVDLDPHATKTAVVTIPASGYVSFYCEYHQSEGMAGVLQAS